MSYGIEDLEQLITSPFYVSGADLKEALPEGQPALTSEVEGDFSTSATITLETRKFTVVYDPTTGVMTMTTKPGGIARTVTFVSTNKWTLTTLRPQYAVITLTGTAGSKTIEIYHLGVVRFTGQAVARFQTAPASLLDADDAWPYLTEVEDNWWVASDERVTVDTSGNLTPTSNSSCVGIFYSANGGEGYWSRCVATKEKTDLIVPGSNISKYLRAVRFAHWMDAERDMDVEFPKQRYVSTATGGSLELHGKGLVGLPRVSGQSDENYRIEIYGEIQRRRGRNTINDIIRAAAAIIQGEPEDIVITRNVDPGDGSYRSAYLEVAISLTRLEELGFTAPFTAILDRIELAVSRAVAAGVELKVIETAGGVWDTAVYDGNTAADTYTA